MGVEQRVSSFTPDNRERAGKSSPLSYKEIIYECLPMYLAMGMTTEEYFHGDIELVKAYRKAHDIKLSMQNQMSWLQGRYIYDALVEVAPYFNSLKPRKPMAYTEEPYPITQADKAQKEKKNQELENAKAVEYMANWMRLVNTKRGGEVSGSGN